MIRKRLGLEVSPTSVVLLQELERWNRLVLRMGRSLAELQRVRRDPTRWVTRWVTHTPTPPLHTYIHHSDL